MIREILSIHVGQAGAQVRCRPSELMNPYSHSTLYSRDARHANATVIVLLSVLRRRGWTFHFAVAHLVLACGRMTSCCILRQLNIVRYTYMLRKTLRVVVSRLKVFVEEPERA